jgi:copper chaperone
MQTETMKVIGLTSEKCIDTVTRALKAIEGVKDVSVSLFQSQVVVKFDGALTGIPQLESALANSGYTARSIGAAGPDRGGCCGGCCG